MLVGLAVLCSCGNGEQPAQPSTTAIAVTTSTTASPERLRAALLVAGDVPGSKPTPDSADPADVVDLSACFPGNPMGARSVPNEVQTPDLALIEGRVERNYTSAAWQGPPDQARAYVETFSSSAGSICVLNEFKSFLTAGSAGAEADSFGLSGTVTNVAIGDRGALLPISGGFRNGKTSVQLGFDLLVFQKGPVLVFLIAGSFQGPTTPGQAVELARKIFGRLP